VLALDDEPAIRAFLRKALIAAGMECVPFQDGAQALDGLRELEFDVMLIDHRMAGMSGTEFTRQPSISDRTRPQGCLHERRRTDPELRRFANETGIRLLPKPSTSMPSSVSSARPSPRPKRPLGPRRPPKLKRPPMPGEPRWKQDPD